MSLEKLKYALDNWYTLLPLDPLFPMEYGKLDVNNKTVIDVGAYNGDTANFFLKRGARKIIAYEIEEKRQTQISTRFKKHQVQVKGAWNGELFPEADVLKMDIEGAEKILTKKHLENFEQFSIALHPDKLGYTKLREMSGMLKQLGARLAVFEGLELIYAKYLK